MLSNEDVEGRVARDRTGVPGHLEQPLVCMRARAAVRDCQYALSSELAREGVHRRMHASGERVLIFKGGPLIVWRRREWLVCHVHGHVALAPGQQCCCCLRRSVQELVCGHVRGLVQERAGRQRHAHARMRRAAPGRIRPWHCPAPVPVLEHALSKTGLNSDCQHTELQCGRCGRLQATRERRGDDARHGGLPDPFQVTATSGAHRCTHGDARRRQRWIPWARLCFCAKLPIFAAALALVILTCAVTREAECHRLLRWRTPLGHRSVGVRWPS